MNDMRLARWCVIARTPSHCPFEFLTNRPTANANAAIHTSDRSHSLPAGPSLHPTLRVEPRTTHSGPRLSVCRLSSLARTDRAAHENERGGGERTEGPRDEQGVWRSAYNGALSNTEINRGERGDCGSGEEQPLYRRQHIPTTTLPLAFCKLTLPHHFAAFC